MFKRWAVISHIPEKFFRLGVAMLDLSTEFGCRMSVLLPEFFTENEAESEGPVPISVMIATAIENGIKMPWRRISSKDAPYLLETYDGTGKVPTITFITDDEDFEVELLPNEIDRQIKEAIKQGPLYVGQKFTWEGKELVLIEMSGDPDIWFYFAPAEAVLIDQTVLYNRDCDPKKWICGADI